MISERVCACEHAPLLVHANSQAPTGVCVCEREGGGGARDQRIDRIISIMTLLICLLLSTMSID